MEQWERLTHRRESLAGIIFGVARYTRRDDMLI